MKTNSALVTTKSATTLNAELATQRSAGESEDEMTKTMEELEAQADKVRLALGVDNPEDKLRALILATAKTVNEAYGIHGDIGIELKSREVVSRLESFIAERRYGVGPAPAPRAKDVHPAEPGSNVIQFQTVKELTVKIPEKLLRWLTEEAKPGESLEAVTIRALEEMLSIWRFDLETEKVRP